MAKTRYSKAILASAAKLQIDESTLDKYFNKGVSSWIHVKDKIPGTTPEQLGMVVVEEFLKQETDKSLTLREHVLVKESKPGRRKVSDMTPKRQQFAFEARLPNIPKIREWALSEQIQDVYLKKYGSVEKAQEHILAAVDMFIREDNLVEEWQAPVEPKHNLPGTKRHSWDMANWHEGKRLDAEKEENKEAVEHHTKKRDAYLQKMKTPKWAQDVR